MTAALLFATVIELVGVCGGDLKARAFFDANNVKVGDPLVLTVDFVGEADFKSLHPPDLSRHVDGADWKIYDDSAKTDTYRDARRLTYRVRPMREGVLWFPALEFSYGGGRGAAPRIVKSNKIPVHAKGGAQVKVDGMSDEDAGYPSPGEMVTDRGFPMGEDEAFAWRKACAKPSADAFAAFSGSAARLNEARMAVLEGNWARALKIYSRLEWVTGQTPQIERGIIAALALKYENKAAVLPVWREIARPFLKYSWKGRSLITLLAFAGLFVLFKIFSRIVKALALVTLAVALPLQATAQRGAHDIFREMEERAREMEENMSRMMSGHGPSFSFASHRRKPVKITVAAAVDRDDVRAGEPFEFIISIDVPKNCMLSQLRISPSVTEGLAFTGQPVNMTDGESANPSNVVKRIALPSRFDVAYKGPLAFEINGSVTQREQSRSQGFFSMSFSQNVRLSSSPVVMDVKPLPAEGRPKNFSGIVAGDVSIHEYPDILRLGTNDVVTLKYRVRANGYIPKSWLPEDCAFEAVRDDSGVEFIRYFVADGAPETPLFTVYYWDIDEKKYKSVSAGCTKLKYIP